MRTAARNAVRVVALLALAPTFHSQTLYGVDGPGLTAFEFTGPPAGCAYPTGPLVGAFPAVGGFCPAPGAFPPPPALDGDIAHDSAADLVYVADLGTIAVYTPAGVFVDSFFPPIAITGMGFDAAAGLLWVTDGGVYGAIAPPPAPGCLAPIPPFVVGPFAVPIGPGMFAGPLTDIDFDPAIGAVIACDVAGIVGSFVPAPAPPPPVFGWFPVAPGACAPLGAPLSGIAVDRAAPPGAGTFYVTDGAAIAYMVPPGGLAPPTFYTPAPCYAAPTPPLSGLAFSSHGIAFGASTTTGAFLPVAGSLGNSFAGNGAFAITVTGLPGSLGFLMYGGGGPACPALPIAGILLNILPPPLPIVLIGPAPAVYPAPLGPALPIGLPLDLQWVVVDPAGAVSATNGLHLTISLP